MDQPSAVDAPRGDRTSVVFDALESPLRYKLWTRLDESEACQTELAEEFGLSKQVIAYHLRKLREAGCIEYCGSDMRNWGTQKFYKSSLLPFIRQEEATHLSQAVREEGSAVVLALTTGDIKEALEKKTMDLQEQRSLIRDHILADRQAVLDSATAVEDFLERIHEIAAESAGRTAESGEEPVNMSVNIQVFQLPDKSDE